MKCKLNIFFIRLALCFIAGGLVYGSSTAQPQNELGKPLIKSFSPKVYKGFPQIFGVAQDTSGIIYFTGNGITEYDGETWRKIPPLGVVTWSIVLGNDGRIYVGGTDDLGYLEADSLGQQQFISLKYLLSEEHRACGQLRQAGVVKNKIYFASKTGYFLEYDTQSKVIQSWKKEPLINILGTVNDELFLEIPEIGLGTVVGNDFQRIAGGDFFKGTSLVNVLPFKNDQLLVCTKNKGLFIYKNNKYFPFSTEADKLLKEWNYVVKKLPDNTFAISVIGQGIIILDEEGKWVHHLNKQDGLPDDIILSMFASPGGTLWLGSGSGLCQVEILSPFSNFKIDEENNPLFIEDIIRFEDRLYAGSANLSGFLYLDKNGQVFRKMENSPKGLVFSFSKTDNELFGMTNKGIYQIKNNTLTNIFKNKENSSSFFAHHESKLKKGLYFLGRQDGLGILYKKNEQYIYVGKKEEIPSNIKIKFFQEKEPGSLWIGTESQGLWHVKYKEDTATANQIIIEEALSYKQTVNQTDLGSTFVYLIDNELTFTGAGGIYRFDPLKKQIIVDARFPLPAPKSDIQKVILAENNKGEVYAHFLFFNGTVELGIYEQQKDQKYIFNAKPFQRLPKDELLNVAKLFPEENGVLWIVGQDGIFKFDGEKNLPDNTFTIKIRSVINADSLLFSGHGVPKSPELSFNQNNIEFHFIATNLNINGENQYQTQLEGFNDKWSEWSAKTGRSFTNVPEGKYIFRVRGKSPSGELGTEASYTFKIFPPWWRTWWAYIGYLVLSVSSLFLFSRWKNSRLRKQREKLQQTVKERTKEIAQKVEELSAINSVQEGLMEQVDMDGIYQLVGDKVKELFKADITYIAILDKVKAMIHFPYGYGTDFSEMETGQGATAYIISTGKPLLMSKEVSDGFQKLNIVAGEKIPASFLGVPIRLGKEIFGVLGIQSTTKGNRFDTSDERILVTIASQVGVALENAQLFKEAEEARAVAEEASAAKSTFLSTVSHELRTPLTSVIGFAKIIKKRLDERILPFVQSEEKKTTRAIKQVNQNLDVVISEGERLTTLINTVLDLAKIEAGRLDWNMELIPMEGIIRQASAATSSLFEQKSLPLKLDIEEDLPLLNADKDRLVQVMINLISNAVKFTDEGGVKINAFRQNGSIVVGVKDSGIGISKEDLPKVFEKFKQVGDTLTDKPKGTGLGLPICKEIIEHHKGDIWVESEFGEGSSFMFSIPLNQKEKLVEKSSGKLIQNSNSVKNVKLWKPSDKTVLVVDDEPSIRSLLRQEISEVGYQVKEAIHGKEAIDMIREEKPDLVLLDLMMPEMNGFDVAAILKNDPKTQDVPIIIVSVIDDQQRFSRLGIDRYITKPIDIGLLLKEIDTLIK